MPAARGPYRVDLQNPVASHPLNRDMVSWWLPLSHLTGGRRLWDLRNYCHQPLTNHPTDGTAWGGASNGFGYLRFDGSDDHTTSTLVMPANQSGFTLAIALRNTSVAQTNKYTIQWGTNLFDIIYGYAANTYEVFWNGGAFRRTIKASVSDTGAHLILCTLDYNTDVYTAYYDGVQTDTASSVTMTFSGSNTFYLGQSGAGNYFAMDLLSCAIFSRAFTPAEATGYYTEFLQGFPKSLRRYPERSWFVLRESAAAAGGATIPVFAHHYRMQGIQ